MNKNYELAIRDGKFITQIVPVKYSAALKRQLLETADEEKRNEIYNQLILCNELKLINLCYDVIMNRFGFLNEDFFDDLYQEGMLLMTEVLYNKRLNPSFKWCTPESLIYGMERYLKYKLAQLSKTLGL